MRRALVVIESILHSSGRDYGEDFTIIFLLRKAPKHVKVIRTEFQSYGAKWIYYAAALDTPILGTYTIIHKEYKDLSGLSHLSYKQFHDFDMQSQG